MTKKPRRKQFRGNYMEVVRELSDFFNARNLSAQESAAVMGVLATKMLPPEMGVPWCDALKFGFYAEDMMKKYRRARK